MKIATVEKIILYTVIGFFLIVFGGSAIFISYLTICSCHNETDIEIPYDMANVDLYEDSRHYCNLVNKSVLEEDEEAMREFSLISFSGCVYNGHGDVLIEIVLKVGEEKYLKSIQNLSLAEKAQVKIYFETGMEYYQGGKDLAEVFPKIDAYLSE